MKVDCGCERLTDNCNVTKVSSIELKGAGRLFVYRNNENPMVYLSIVQPPQIIEVNVDDVNNPYLGKVYQITSDEGQFVGLNMVYADDRYIATTIMRVSDFKPFLRVFDR